MLVQGAVISNQGFGGGTLVDAAQKAFYNNLAKENPEHLFVYPSGNEKEYVNANNPKFGCALEMPTQICVGASTSSDTIAHFSNRGDMVHVLAPGFDILSTTVGQQYKYKSGTSFAAPHVTGLAALVRTMRTRVTRASEIKHFILDNVQVKSQYGNACSTSGLIDAYATIKAVVGKCNFI